MTTFPTVRVAAVQHSLPRAEFGADFPAEIPDGVDCLGRGRPVIVDPTGAIVAGPPLDQGAVIPDRDLRVGLRVKRWFDGVGHYSHPNLFPLAPLELADPPAGKSTATGTSAAAPRLEP